MKIKLLRSYGSRWGPGKVHLAVRHGHGYVVAACTNKPIHAQEYQGDRSEVTCERCGADR